MSFKIDNDIPLPDESANRNNRYPFKDLKVGESFQYSDVCDFVTKNRIRSRLANLNKDNGKAFIWGEYDGGIRVWRIK